MIQIKRAYDEATGEDGQRILVDRIWPRGLSKDKAQFALWLKEVAPSTELRKWFNHEPEKWPEFQRQYKLELQHNAALAQLEHLAKQHNITLIYAAKDTEHNNAVVLQQILQDKLS